MRAVADKKGLELKNSLTPVAAASADPERVKQIIMNLVSNAIKYTAKGTVEIMGKEDAKFIYITVVDTGFGISSDNMKNLFSKFYRVKTADTEKIAGTGLGLWISREIARKMEGDIEVESIEGVGSHFTLKLKKA
jgi:signal transduction histidine kinase